MFDDFQFKNYVQRARVATLNIECGMDRNWHVILALSMTSDEFYDAPK